MSRFDDALYIQSACNPSGVARSLVQAIDECRADPAYRGTQSVRDDPAVRLIVHQLSFLCGFENLAWDWHAAHEACIARATPETRAALKVLRLDARP